MARRRAAGKQHHQEDPGAVLAGRVEVEPATLLRMVRRANPTGMDLPPAETAQRYRLKSRLQSLLIRRFGPDLTLRDVDASGGTASLWHRPLAVDGCHVVAQELEPDAHAWFRGRPACCRPPRPAPTR